MSPEPVWLANSACRAAGAPSVSDFVTLEGEPYVRIGGVDQLAPFLMSVVGAGEIWLFVGSNGPFTAGRVDPDGALFPYQTVDRILRRSDTSGALSVFLVRRGGRWLLWEPWQPSGCVYRLRRSLYKHVCGTSVVFEEVNDDLGLCFRWTLCTCEPFGLVRWCSLANLGGEPAEVRLLDGWHQLLPPGVGSELFGRFSYLAAAYMRHERPPGLPLGLFTLNAAVSDRAEPSEALRVSAAWSLGHRDPTILLCDRQVEAFRRGELVEGESEVRGELGAFLVADEAAIAPGEAHRWVHACDTRLDHASVARLRAALADPGRLDAAVRAAVADDQARVRALIGAADGLQHTADHTASAHHFANTLYNCMRGGTFADAYSLPVSDLAGFLRARSRPLADRHAAWIAGLPQRMPLERLRVEAEKSGDPRLVRLAREYLPLTFSRRHGDPSRPWNQFAIHVKDADGSPLHGYQGNWRDIFQNWESLAQSYPDALGAMLAVFLNASTADGYNPYRITRDAIDWEVDQPGNLWSNIGYWGDHQIVYLLRLLESAERFHPGGLAGGLREAAYAYARVPYEIAGFDALAADPRRSIRFDRELHEELSARAHELGADGKLVRDASGDVALVTLAEKLLLPALVKLTNLVPEGGIWLNTQRPEWNDANNALAGWGLSVVTTHYLRRYLVFLDGVLAEAGDLPIALSEPVAELAARVTDALRNALPHVARGCDDTSRFEVMETLGRAGEAHRRRVYGEGVHTQSAVCAEDLRALIAAALPAVEQTLRANRRPDGMSHSYNLLRLSGRSAAIERLPLMLEGQVAALSSGTLTPAEGLALLRALRASDLYRADQRSYVLYPDREIAPFEERNLLPPDAASLAPLLGELLAANDTSLADVDATGRWRFQADLRNARDVAERLDRLAADGRWRASVARDRQAVLDVWEAVFHHRAFTGRSGAFFMFEGLGSIYWHMVAKLLVAVQECWREADRVGDCAAGGLADAYDEVRDGLGFRKTSAEYGAFPTDPYSHTPRHRGAQQPGMTGQVKEEILTRWGELGVEVAGGRVRFAPRLLHRREFLTEPSRFEYVDTHGSPQSWDLPAESLAFTYCQVPVCYRLSDAPRLLVERTEGAASDEPTDTLSAADSASLFARTGDVRRITVWVARDLLRG